MKVDVIKFLRSLDNALLSRRATPAECLQLHDATDAIAELIAADEEYDAARVAVLCDLGSETVIRYSNAKERRAAAILACKGQDHER